MHNEYIFQICHQETVLCLRNYINDYIVKTVNILGFLNKLQIIIIQVGICGSYC